MRQLIIIAVVGTILFGCSNQQKPKTVQNGKDSDKIKVYLLGTFHFSQTDSTYNVMDEKHQNSILELCKKIASNQPDKIFVERQPEFEAQNKLDSLYQRYVQTDEIRYRNENYQVGFRTAKMLGHSKVYQCDNPGRYGYHYTRCLEYAQEHNQMDILERKADSLLMRLDDIVDTDSLQNNLTLFDYIKWLNSDEYIASVHKHYATVYPLIGSTDYYNIEDENTLIGAELTADWYRRNIMIYTKMINQLDYNEKGIFLIIGADHIPILQYLFDANPRFEVINAEKWLE